MPSVAESKLAFRSGAKDWEFLWCWCLALHPCPNTHARVVAKGVTKTLIVNLPTGNRFYRLFKP